MNASRTARARARAELTAAIKDEARRQLATSGADRLSLRAVARELGVVSSALYRYFPSRDDLLTALITDAYQALGDAVTSADSTDASPRQRWRAICHATREWARAHRHEYALLYGSPVPGYQAPRDTVAYARTVPLRLVDAVRAAWATDRLVPPEATELPPALAEQTATLAAEHAPELPPQVLASVVIAWTQLFGMISFELFGHLAGSVDPSDEFFEHAVRRMADFLGLAR